MKIVLGLIVAVIATAAYADGQQPIVINNYITQTQTAPPPAVFNNNSQPNNVTGNAAAFFSLSVNCGE